MTLSKGNALAVNIVSDSRPQQLLLSSCVCTVQKETSTFSHSGQKTMPPLESDGRISAKKQQTMQRTVLFPTNTPEPQSI
eukprot:4636195-Amphidinium_carterae.1